MALMRQHGELSQAQLCKLAGLSSSTASYIVGRLREKHLIVEKRGESSKRGAKPVIVSIRPRAQLVAGVEISPTDIFAGLFDYDGTLVESLRAAISGDHTPNAVVNLVEITVRGLLSKHSIRADNIVGVGLTVSGAISPAGVVRLSAPMGWKDVPLRELVQDRFNAPVHVFTTRVRIFSEIGHFPAGAANNIVLLNFADGVGAGVAENGRLAHGATNRVGEIGHIIFDPAGPLCGCGHRGCLETFASGPALAARIRDRIQNGTETVLKQWIHPEDSPREILGYLGSAIASNDQYALEVRGHIADYVSRATAIAINCYDPDTLILTGYVIAQSPDYFIQAAQERITSDVFDHYSRDIKIVVDHSGEESLIRGVATAVLNASLETI